MQLKLLSTSFYNSSPLLISLSIIFWIILWLLIIEGVIYAIVPYNPPTKSPNSIQKYLEYGRSVEGKIRQMIGPTDETTTPVTLAGWIDPERERWNTLPTHPETPDGLLIAIYGMSHAQRLGRALDKIEEPPITVRFLGGPGAPPNHSYATYQMDKGRHTAQVVILGIAASSLKDMTTFTHLSKAFEYPLPYTYPKYHKVGNHLEEVWPSVRTMSDFRRVLNDETLWEKYLEEMKAEDSFYHPFLFYENVMDNLLIFRFIRRAYAKKHANRIKDSIYVVSQGSVSDQQGFIENSDVIQALRLIIQEFAHQVRRDNQLPIVVLFNGHGYKNHLTQTLAGTMKEENIPFLDSHIIAPSNDPKNLASDHFHFSKKVNKQFAKVILEMILEHKVIP